MTIVTITSTRLVVLVGRGRPAHRTGRDIGISKTARTHVKKLRPRATVSTGHGLRGSRTARWARVPLPDAAAYLRKTS